MSTSKIFLVAIKTFLNYNRRMKNFVINWEEYFLKFKKKIALLMILAAIQIPCAVQAAEEDKDLALIAAEQEKSGESERLDEINPALTESISTKKSQETDKEIKERKKKLKQSRKEKEKANERKLADSKKKSDKPRKDEPTIIIDQAEPTVEPEEPIIITPAVEPATSKPQQFSTTNPTIAPQTIETVTIPDEKIIYNNFAEVARAAKFIPLYVPKKSGYEITALYSQPGIVEVRYGRRWEPTVSLTIRTHKRAEGEELKDISGVTGIKWRVDTSTGTTIYIAKISETKQVAAWAVGHYTFSAQAENLSFAGFHSLVADELVELSTHYYLDF